VPASFVVLTLSVIALIAVAGAQEYTQKNDFDENEYTQLIFNQAESYASISPHLNFEILFENGFFHIMFDDDDDRLSKLLPSLGLNRSGSAVFHRDGYIKFLRSHTQDIEHGDVNNFITVGDMALRTVAWGIDDKPETTDVHGIEVTAFMAAGENWIGLFFQASLYLDDDLYNISVFADDEAEGKLRITQIVNELILNKPDLTTLLQRRQIQ